MAQNWYFGGSTSGPGCLAPYAPATFKGGWDNTSSVDDRILSPFKIGTSDSSSASETSATNPFRVCVVRGISPKLAAQSLSGTIDIVLGLLESNSAADFYTKIYAYITQGDSDLVRGVVVDWTESAAGGGSEWPTTSTGRALQSAQSVGAVAVQDGDRLVVEFGYSSENSVTTSRTGSVRIGGRLGTEAPMSDLTASSTNTSTEAGFVVFSASITLSSSEPTNFTPETAIILNPLPYDSGAFDVVSSTYALWWTHTVAVGTTGIVASFAGATGAGNYVPAVTAYIKNGSDYDRYNGSGFDVSFQSYVLPVTAADQLFYRVYSSDTTNPPGRTLDLTVVPGPTVPADNADQYLITEDDDNVSTKAAIIDKTTGAILGYVDLVVSENGVVADSGTFVFTDKSTAGANEPYIYNADFSLVTAVAGVTISQGAGGQGNVPVATDGTDFWCAQYQSGSGDILVSQFDQAGALVDQWSIPLPAGWSNRVDGIAVARDASVLYYTRTVADEPIKRWDLVTDMAMADFYTPASGFYITNPYVLRDGTILVVEQDFIGGDQVLQFDDAATVLNTYTFSDPFSPSSGDWFIDHIAPAQNDPVSFGIWFQQTDVTFSSYRDFYFERIDVATGAATLTLANVKDLESFLLINEPDVDVPSEYFGAPNCCPLVILGARVVTGSITVIKVTSPSATGQSFDFSTTGLVPGTFSLLDGESQEFPLLATGTYGVTESLPVGWTQTSIVVSNGDPPDAIEIDGNDVTVTFTNTQQECPGLRSGSRQDGLPYQPVE